MPVYAYAFAEPDNFHETNAESALALTARNLFSDNGEPHSGQPEMATVVCSGKCKRDIRGLQCSWEYGTVSKDEQIGYGVPVPVCVRGGWRCTVFIISFPPRAIKYRIKCYGRIAHTGARATAAAP